MILLPLLMLASAQQASANEADLRCMAAIAAVTDSDSQGSQDAIAPAMTFYFGRIEGRTPGFDVEAGLRPLLNQQFIDREVQSELDRCSAELVAYPGVLERIGEALEARPKP